MSAWLGALFLVGGVLVLCRLFGVIRRSRSVFALVQESLLVISDRGLDDEAKEQRLQRNALKLFAHFVILLIAGAAALALPLGIIWLLAQTGAMQWDAVLETTLSVPFLLATLVGTVAALIILRRHRKKRPGRPAAHEFENRYSGVDRLLHHVAFATAPIQVGLAGLEERWYRRRLTGVRAERPVFITALPRAGTTLLLDLCAATGEFVTHTYRRMPFVLTPLAWESFSRRFRVADAPRERAHGDGMQVSADSPEAFEEMIWLAFWEEHYVRDRILPWDVAEENAEFERFFRSHAAKLAALEPPLPNPAPKRYLSKNNGNIARLQWLSSQFPDARFVIPFRPPLQHAQSLLRQHRNFLAIHARDPFARHYMAGVGHFDFGENLRPIDFGGWLDREAPSDPKRLEFWLRYWTAAYAALAGEAGERVCFVDFDGLSHHPEAELDRLADFLEIQDRARFLAGASRVRVPKPHATDETAVRQEVLSAASAVHARLLGLSLARRLDRPSGAPPATVPTASRHESPRTP